MTKKKKQGTLYKLQQQMKSSGWRGAPEEESETQLVTTVSFGRYKGESVETLMKDTQYVGWLLNQPWFPKKYPALFKTIGHYLSVTPPVPIPVEENLNQSFSRQYLKWAMWITGVYETLEKVDVTELSPADLMCYTFYNDIAREMRAVIERDRKASPESIEALRAIEDKLPD
jgi:hypothetical protein